MVADTDPFIGLLLVPLPADANEIVPERPLAMSAKLFSEMTLKSIKLLANPCNGMDWAL